MKRRGSAILFVVVIVAAITTIWAATMALAAHTRSDETMREDKVVASVALDGAIEQMKADIYSASATIPVVRTVTVGGASCTFTASDNSGSLPKSLLVTATTTVRSQSFSETRVVGAPIAPKALYFAIFSNSNLILVTNAVTTGAGGNNGDVGSNGVIGLLNATSTINGDLDSTGLIACSGTVVGSQWPLGPATPFPAPNHNFYQGGSQIGSGNLKGYSFGVGYPILYSNGDLTMKGAFQGIGTVYVNGNLQINQDVTYNTVGTHVAFIVDGDIDVTGGANNIAGYYYCTGTFSANSINVTKGAVAANSFAIGNSLTATFDPYIWTNPNEAVNMRVPGFFP